MLKWIDYTSNADNLRSDLLGYFANERATIINATLSELRTQYLVPFVTGEMDIDENWDVFQKALQDAGIDELRTLVSAYFAEKGATPNTVLK